jgi:hypothetical protein
LQLAWLRGSRCITASASRGGRDIAGMIERFIAVKLMRAALLFDQAERYAVTASGIIVAAMALIDCAADVAVK